jgi:arginase
VASGSKHSISQTSPVVRQRGVEIIGVPLDMGANMRGTNLGPAAVRIADLHSKIRALGYQLIDSGDIAVPVRETLPSSIAAQKYLPIIAGVTSELKNRVETALERGNLPITIGGDHSLAIGSIQGANCYFSKKNQKLGVIWIDAHADLNTPESSPSGNLHGMPLAAILGMGHPELLKIGGDVPRVDVKNVALIGIRTLDADEKEICRRSGIQYFTMREIDERGISSVLKDAIACASDGTSGIHVSFDLDGVDPLYAPGVSTPVIGGLSYREVHLIMETVHDTGLMSSLDIVELNPLRDSQNQTADFAVELIQSALGKSIL